MMNPDDPIDLPTTPSENGQFEQDLAVLFKRTMPTPPAVDVDSLFVALGNRMDVRKNANTAKYQVVGRMDASCTVRQHLFSRRRKMLVRFVAMILVTIGIVVSFLLWNPIGPTPVLAQMQKAVEKTKSITYTITSTTDDKSPEKTLVMLLGRNHIRAEFRSPQENIFIVDLSERKAVSLFPDGQAAVVMEDLTVPQNINLLQFLTELNRHATREQRAAPERKFEGLEVHGFVVEFDHTKFNVWIDKKTDLPVRFESDSKKTIPDGAGGQREQLTREVWSNFVFDRELDKALFNPTPPNGYEVKKLGPNGLFAPYPSSPKQNKGSVEPIAQEKTPPDRTTVQIKDEEKLQGTWQITSCQNQGFELDGRLMDQFKAIKWVFKEDRLIKEAGMVDGKPSPEQTLKFKLNPKENPKHIDLIPLNGEMKGEKAALGVYEVEGDELKICLPQTVHPDRPKVLSSELGTYDILFVLKRKK